MGIKILGQVAPNATTETELYEVPADTVTVVSSLVVCNRDDTVNGYRISVSQGGGATADKDYIYGGASKEVPIAPVDTFVATIGLTLAAGDIIRVYNTTAQLSFSLYGEEIP